ncbi:MAG TPA: Ppx/GppA phosphatase family protein [Phycisphaerales bacterium]|nr:Ppx/GppA phosphatase family protein [Phycisphaerales bacterium]
MRADTPPPSLNSHPPPAAQSNLWLAGRRLAVIDVGSNSLRLLAVELLSERSWTTLAQDRAMTRLAHTLAQTGALCTEAMATSVEAIARFKETADALGIQTLRAFATAAVREASNGPDFAALVRDRTGITLEIVSALDEGKLTYRSAARVHDLSAPSAAVVDIGGGSMEVVFSLHGIITENTSMPLGAVRLTESFGGPDAAAGARHKEMRRWIDDTIAAHVRPHETSPAILVGCGGAFTTLLTLAAAHRGHVVSRNAPNLATLGPVSAETLKTIVKELRALPLEQRLRLPGLPSDRADIAVAGLTAIERLVKHLGVAQVHVHPGGFREGLLLRMIDEEVAARTREDAPAREPDLVAAARDFARRCRYDQPHSEHVAMLATRLYDQFREQPGRALRVGSFPNERAILQAAAILHDVGTMVEYRRHHRHSQTIVRHADLPHWPPHHLELVALIARYHRRAVPSADHKDFAALPRKEQDLVLRLSAILRTADGLDRSHTQVVRDARVRFGKKQLRLELDTTGDAALDARAAAKKSDLLRSVLDRPIDVALPTPSDTPLHG